VVNAHGLDRYAAANGNSVLVAWPLSSANREPRACPSRLAVLAAHSAARDTGSQSRTLGRHGPRSWLIACAVIVLWSAGGVTSAAADSQLAEAAKNRDVEAVRSLLGQRVDVNAPGSEGTPALHWAVRIDDMEIARLLLTAGADATLVNRYGLAPLPIAASNGSASMIRLLLDAGADPNVTDAAGETALMTAASIGSLDAVTLLLDRGATIDAIEPAFDQTALFFAVRGNHPVVVEGLVERGANVHLRTRVGEAPRWVLPNSVPGFSHGVGIYGADPHLPTLAGTTPLMAAAGVNWVVAQTYTESPQALLEAVALCLELGADVNATNSMGLTALLGAANRGSNEIIELLVAHGARLDIQDKEGRTPLRWAEGVFLAAVASTMSAPTGNAGKRWFGS
jgi:ankyrin repeat protein